MVGTRRGWLFLTKTDEESLLASNGTYDDFTGLHYSYDSNVPNSQQVSVGDLVVIRVDSFVAGYGYIDQIEKNPDAVKVIYRCPFCNQTNWRRRKTVTPAIICDQCKHEFDEGQLLQTESPVTAFKATYAPTWVEAVRPIMYNEPILLDAMVSTSTFNAIRPLRLEAVDSLLSAAMANRFEQVVQIPQDIWEIAGGHTEAIVRRRRGQREFRFKMMQQFGEFCAFTGEQPPEVLEAAHIASFAKHGEHQHDGGLLLRRDNHALFDRKLLTINPKSWKIEVAPNLRRFDTYRALEGRDLMVAKNQRPERILIEAHYLEAQAVFGSVA
ncbi:CBAL domain containing protein [Acidimicrobiia bacterium]